MCRWIEHVGATAGATIIEAMRKEAMQSAFCIASDATGVLVRNGASGCLGTSYTSAIFVDFAEAVWEGP